MATDPTDCMVYAPLDTPKRVDEDIWVVDGPVIRMAFPGGRLPFPTRMVVVRLPSGGLWLWSPIRLTPALRAHVEALGPIRHLVSPNALHYAYIGSWKEASPAATAWASPGVEKRATSQGITTAFDRELTDEVPPAFEGVLDQVVFRGSRLLEEVVFFHRPSRTVILADLVERFEKERVPPGMWWLVRLAGATFPGGKTPIDLRATFLGRKAVARRCLERILAWDPERVLIAHGRSFDTNGREALEQALGWLL